MNVQRDTGSDKSGTPISRSQSINKKLNANTLEISKLINIRNLSESKAKLTLLGAAKDDDFERVKSPILDQQVKDFLKIKRIFETDFSDEKFDERRVIMLKSLLRQKEKENQILRQSLNQRDHVFLRCNELCAFLSHVLSDQYIEKRKQGIGEHLGFEMSQKDRRSIKTSLGWKQVIDDPQFNNVERKILQEMSVVMALPMLSKSPEDIKIIRKNVIQKLSNQDEKFARLYFISLLKEIKAISH